MIYYVYILKSTTTGKYYCGQTNDLTARFSRHNEGEVISTRRGVPWILIFSKEFKSRAEAMRIEKQVKGRGIERWLVSFKEDIFAALPERATSDSGGSAAR